MSSSSSSPLSYASRLTPEEFMKTAIAVTHHCCDSNSNAIITRESIKDLIRQDPFWIRAFENEWQFIEKLPKEAGRFLSSIFELDDHDNRENCYSATLKKTGEYYIIVDLFDQGFCIFKDTYELGVLTTSEYEDALVLRERFGNWRNVPLRFLPGELSELEMDEWWEKDTEEILDDILEIVV